MSTGDERQSLKGRGGGEVRRRAVFLLRRRKRSSSAGRGAQHPFPRPGAPPPDTRSAGAQSVAVRRSAKAGRSPGPGATAPTAPAARSAVPARRETCPHRPPTAGKLETQQVLFLRGFLSLCVIWFCGLFSFLFVWGFFFPLLQLSCNNKRERRSEPRRD